MQTRYILFKQTQIAERLHRSIQSNNLPIHNQIGLIKRALYKNPFFNYK